MHMIGARDLDRIEALGFAADFMHLPEMPEHWRDQRVVAMGYGLAGIETERTAHDDEDAAFYKGGHAQHRKRANGGTYRDEPAE